ncbi:uncharacterized protein LOC111284325 [Durio zibethinus]|uniref:Uncharacterized protein LOC111284325 n=1 Tax=Durio zibethinus TaxID=66656 RepID=A0A6P5XLK4_DURZI|nr:uncharacterized protein LOC111284325 [Durio zibethinus]
MRIRKRYPSFPIIQSLVASCKELPSRQEGMEVSSFPARDEGRAREAPEKVLNDWQSIMAEAHRLLGYSSYAYNNCTIRPHVQEEHSNTNSVSNGETVTEIQARNERNKKSLKGNYSGTAIVNTKGRTGSSSSFKGDAKGIFLGNSKDGKAETTMRIGGSAGRKKRTDASLWMEVGSSRRGFANGSCGLKYKNKAEDQEQYLSGSSIKNKKVKTRSLTSIYDDVRSLMTSPSKLNEIEQNTNGKSVGEDLFSE